MYLINKIGKVVIKLALIFSVKLFEVLTHPNDLEHSVFVIDEPHFQWQSEIRRGRIGWRGAASSGGVECGI